MHWGTKSQAVMAALLGVAAVLWGVLPEQGRAAEPLAGAEYFFDEDPGPGNGTALTAADGAFDEAEEEIQVDLTGVTGSVGPHTLYLRFQDAAGVWGVARPVLGDNLFVAPYNFRILGDKWIAGAEYFFDTDPGEGNGAPLTAADGAFDESEEEIDFSGVDPSALGSGVHHLFLRLQDSEGVWGPARRVAFQGRPLGFCEYYLDVDPGEGAGTPLPAVDGSFDTGSEPMELADIPTDGLEEGWHTLYGRCRDARGYWGDPEPHEFYMDYTDPVVEITAPVGCTPDSTPLLTCTVTDARPTTITEVTVNGTVVSKLCGDDLDPLDDGSHTVAVTAADAAGNRGTDSSNFAVGAAAPTVTLSSPADGSCSDDATPALNFTVDDPTATVVVEVDGVVVDKNSGDLLESLSEGTHTVTVSATNSCSATGTDEAIVLIDTTAPAVAVQAPADGSFTNDATPALTFTVEEDNPGTTVVTVDGTEVDKTSGDALDLLTDGSHTVTVTQTDCAGNEASGSVTFTVDTTPPSVAVAAPADGSFANDPAPVLTFSVDESNLGTTVVTVDGQTVQKDSGEALDALGDGSHTVRVTHTDRAGNENFDESTFTVDATQPAVAITAPADGSLTGDPTPLLTFTVAAANPGTTSVTVDGETVQKISGDALDGLGDGSHTVRVAHTDQAGNEASDSSVFTVDTTQPAVTLSAPADGAFTKDPTPLLAFAVAEDNLGTTVVTVDGETTGKNSGDPLDALGDGAHTVCVLHADQVALEGSACSTFTVDATLPAVAITSPAEGALTNDPTPPLVFAIDDTNLGTSQVMVDGAEAGTSSGEELDSLADGEHTVAVTHTDLAANQASGASTFTVDTVPPAVAVTSPVDGWRYRERNLTLAYTVSEGAPAVWLDQEVEDLPSGSEVGPLSVGTHTVEVRAPDAAGNVGSYLCTFEITETHVCDQDGDRQISQSELLRVIQLFNSESYHCDASGEDGYAPGPGDQSCRPHDADYLDGNWAIGLSELLRLIQLYNSGGYRLDPAGEDGFLAGL